MDNLAQRSASAAANMLADDGSFGPQYGQEFDFTMVFNNIILTIIPAVLMIVVSPVYAIASRGKCPMTSKGGPLLAKLAVALGLVVFEVARNVVWAYPEDATSLLTKTTLAAKILASLSSAILAAVLYCDHRYARQSSISLSLFLFITAITEGSRTRSFFLRGIGSSGMDSQMATIAGLTLAGVVLRIALVVLLELPKDLIQHADENLDPNATVGFWSRSLLLWANSLMLRGYKREIKMDDLPSLGAETKSQLLADRMSRAWDAANKEDKYALTKVCVRVLLRPILSALAVQVAFAAIFFGSVFTIWATLRELGIQDHRVAAVQGLIGANVLIQALTAIAQSRIAETVNHLSILIRGSLTSIMTEKAIRLTPAAAKKCAILSLMTADINGIIDTLKPLFQMTTAVPTMAIGFYILWTVVGYAAFFAIIPVALAFAAGRFIGKKMHPAMIRWNQMIQHRVSETTAVLVHTKAVKMMGLDAVIIHFLNALREREIDGSITFRKIRLAAICIFPLNYWFTPFIVLAPAVKLSVWKDGLDPVGVWVVLGFLLTIADPLYAVLKGWTLLGGVTACIQRIQEFLVQDERVDIRQVKDFTSASETTLDEKGEKGITKTQQSSLAEDGVTNSPCLVLENVSVAANEADGFVLKSLSFSIPANRLTIIIGPVGSGKSVLAKTLIGEIEPTGCIYASSLQMAYCDQNTWLPDGSMQDAITMHMGLELDEARYNAVIEACALGIDIQELGGNQVRIGSNGSKLSGGQRQRLALARALYSSCPIIVADDVLSALDKRTAMHVFKAVFGVDGMLKRQGRTAIMVAHERAWLSSADQVVSLHCNGEPVTIYNGHEAIRMFSETEGVAISAAYLSPHDEEKLNDNVAAPDEALDHARQDAEWFAYKPDLSLYRYLFGSVPKILGIVSICLILIYGFAERCPELYLRLWSGYAPKKTDYVYGMLGFTFVSMILAIVNGGVFYLRVVPKISRQTHATFTHSVFGATLSFLTSTRKGNLLNRFGQDLTIFGSELPAALNFTLYGMYKNFHEMESFANQYMIVLGLFIAATGFILAGTNYTVLLLPLIFVVLWYLQKFYLRTSQQMRLLEIEAKAPLFAELSEMGAGVEHMRSFGIQGQMVARSYQRLDDSQRPYYVLLTIQRWLLLMLDILTVIVAAVLVTVALLATHTTSTAGLGLSLYSMVNFTELSKEIVQAWTALETSLGAVMRLRDFEQNTPSERDSADMQDAPDTWPTKGCIEFQKVSATYGSEPSLPLALRGITTAIEGGKKVVITGRTGSGKSTMVLSILNLVDITGTILIDNLDITMIPRAQLRTRITSVPQDSLEFSGSVWENLLPFGTETGNIVTEVAVQDRLDEIGLWDYIKTKGGLQKPITDMGFSAGQKQLFNVVRAILHHAQFETKIVLMDEVTSSVDHVANERMQAMMETAFRGSTWIIISHDTRAVADCDVVLHMSGGALVDRGRLEQDAGETTKAPSEK